MRQIVASIRERQFLRLREERRQVSWQTRQLAQFTAATIPQDPKRPNTSTMDAASVLSMDEEEVHFLKALAALPADSPGRSSTPPVRENKPGSFERLLAGFKPPRPPD